MPESRLLRKVLHGQLSRSVRSVGGQKRMFKDYLKASLKKAYLAHGDLEEIAADRQSRHSDCGAGVYCFVARFECCYGGALPSQTSTYSGGKWRPRV